MATQRNRRTARGFTLLEVLMVIVIIGLLVGFGARFYFGAQRGAEEDLTRAAVESGFSGALDNYRLNVGHYPSEDEGGLMALVERPSDEEVGKKWRGPYITQAEKLKDPWGTEYIYKCPGNFNEETYDLSSAGPDRQEGTDDDITNWRRT